MADQGRLLIVEPNWFIAGWIEDVVRDLMGSPADCIVAQTNAEAHAALTNTRPDLTVLEIELPDGPVDCLAERLRESGIPFIVASAWSKESLAKQASPFEQCPWLLKPVSELTLVQHVRAFLG